MTVSELVILLLNQNPDKKVYIGCQGYTNVEDKENNTQIALTKDGDVLIHDECYYKEI